MSNTVKVKGILKIKSISYIGLASWENLHQVMVREEMMISLPFGKYETKKIFISHLDKRIKEDFGESGFVFDLSSLKIPKKQFSLIKSMLDNPEAALALSDYYCTNKCLDDQEMMAHYFTLNP